MLHQDNISAHMALSVKQFPTSKNIIMMDHPPYSPDFAHETFLFPTVKPVPFLSRRGSGKRGKSSKEPSQILVPELLPAMAAPNVEGCEC
ncbi:hypothetical protein TNCV_1710101 [Trichonephila clavipes]|nr:hypothetical protein TNCV_1710101 [Trichonephila clavipes]